jgi:hypothetical protein
MVPGERDAAGAGLGDDGGEGAEVGGEGAGAQPLRDVERVGEAVEGGSIEGPGDGSVGVVGQAEGGEEAEPEGGRPRRLRDPVPASDVGTDAEAHGDHSGR